MLLKCNSLLQYLTAHCKSLKWIWHSFGTNNFIHECVIQFSLKLCHAQQEDIFFLLWQWYLQYWMTPPVQEKHEITMSMERWFRLLNSNISTAKVTVLLLSLTVTAVTNCVTAVTVLLLSLTVLLLSLTVLLLSLCYCCHFSLPVT